MSCFLVDCQKPSSHLAPSHRFRAAVDSNLSAPRGLRRQHRWPHLQHWIWPHILTCTAFQLTLSHRCPRRMRSRIRAMLLGHFHIRDTLDTPMSIQFTIQRVILLRMRICTRRWTGILTFYVRTADPIMDWGEMISANRWPYLRRFMLVFRETLRHILTIEKNMWP